MSRILVIDDEDVIRMLVMEILETAGHEVTGAESAERALGLLEHLEFDLVVSDVVMPGLSGLELLEAVRAHSASLPVVLVTGAGTYDTLSQALTRGAAGLVTKPFAHADLQAAVADALERSARSRDDLKERLLAPTLASALANAIEARDSYLHGHCERLASLAVRLAELLELPADDVETIRLGAILHDIGKIGIPDSVLLKPAALDDDERRIVETHPEIGDKLLEPLELLAAARPIVRHHHERWDGDGYPDGLAGAAIPLGARDRRGRGLRRGDVRPSALPAAAHARADRRGAATHSAAAQWDPALVDLVLALIDSGELQLGADGLRLLEHAAGEPSLPATAILLVEDDDEHARLVVQTLEEALGDTIVARARSAADAAELLTGSTWALAIVDSQLRDGHGLDVLDALRAHDPSLPVVLLTGESSDELAIEAFRHGASDYVGKDTTDLDALARRVRGLVAA